MASKATTALVAVLGLALVAALGVIAFLLGQRSVAPTTVSSADPIAMREVPSESVPPRETTMSFARLPPVEPGVTRIIRDGEIIEKRGNSVRIIGIPDGEESPSREDVGEVPARTPERSVATATAETGRGAAVPEYLQQVRALHVGPQGGDPNGFAQELLADVARGNTSGFDRLVRDARDAEDRAKSIRPPREAAAYHRELLDLLSKSTDLLAKQRDAIAAKNTDQVMSLLGSAKGLEQKAQALDAMQQDLERAYKR
jgi:hypothetical protein